MKMNNFQLILILGEYFVILNICNLSIYLQYPIRIINFSNSRKLNKISSIFIIRHVNFCFLFLKWQWQWIKTHFNYNAILFSYVFILVQFIPSCQSFFKPKYLKRFEECRPDGHMEFDEGWRNHKRISSEFIKEDDSTLKEGWYRFTNGSFRMLQRDELFINPFRNRVRIFFTF